MPAHHKSHRPPSSAPGAPNSERKQALQSFLAQQSMPEYLQSACKLVEGRAKPEDVAWEFLCMASAQQLEFANTLCALGAGALVKHTLASEIERQANGKTPNLDALEILSFRRQAGDIALGALDMEEPGVKKIMDSLPKECRHPSLVPILADAFDAVSGLCEETDRPRSAIMELVAKHLREPDKQLEQAL